MKQIYPYTKLFKTNRQTPKNLVICGMPVTDDNNIDLDDDFSGFNITLEDKKKLYDDVNSGGSLQVITLETFLNNLPEWIESIDYGIDFYLVKNYVGEVTLKILENDKLVSSDVEFIYHTYKNAIVNVNLDDSYTEIVKLNYEDIEKLKNDENEVDGENELLKIKKKIRAKIKKKVLKILDESLEMTKENSAFESTWTLNDLKGKKGKRKYKKILLECFESDIKL